MNQRLKSVGCAVGILWTGWQASAEPFDASVAAEIARFQKEFPNRPNACGGMVIGLIDEKGTKVFAVESKSVKGTMNGDTVFELGSVTKVFTTLIAFELEREGTWKLSDRLQSHLPGGVSAPKYEDEDIKLENLARQDSGLPWHAHPPLDKIDGKFDLIEIRIAAESTTISDINDFLESFELPQKPGTKFSYSNVGMALLGCAAENATSLSFEELIENKIATPLEMSSTKVELDADLKSRIFPGHWQSGEPSSNINFKAMKPAGQLFSTVNDLLKFLSANLELTESEMSPSCRLMQKTQHKGSQRFGDTASPWLTDRVYQPPGSNLIGHGGGGFGYLAFVGMDTKKKRGVVVLSNQMNLNSNGVGWTILQQFPMTPNNLDLTVRQHEGVGFSLKPAPATSEIMISKVFAGSPAEKVALSEDSIIKTINGTPTVGKTMGECLKLLGGKEGDIVVLKVLPPGEEKEKTFEISCAPFLSKTEWKTAG